MEYIEILRLRLLSDSFSSLSSLSLYECGWQKLIESVPTNFPKRNQYQQISKNIQKIYEK